MKFLDLGTIPVWSHAPPVNKWRKQPLFSEVQIGSSGVPNCPSRSLDHFDIPIDGSTMKIVDARAITMGAVAPCDARFKLLFGSGSHKFQYFLINPFLYDK